MNRLSLLRAALGGALTSALLLGPASAGTAAAPALPAPPQQPPAATQTADASDSADGQDAADGEEAGASGPQRPVIGGERLGLTGTQVQPERGAPKLPKLSSRAWIVADADSGEVLASHNAHRPLAPASTLKMLFAETVMPNLDPEKSYLAEHEHFRDLGPGSSAVGVAPGLSYTVSDLWHGVFLASGNDAVYALTALNGGKEKTVREMNERARELQALDTHVVNPDGYDGDGQVSSAYDLTLIARAGMQNEHFRAYAATDRFAFPGAGEGKKRESYEIQTTNRLLLGASGLTPYDGIMGVKNGYTSKAGHTFTGAAERDGRTLLVTCMDPDGDGLTVYREAAKLLDWGFDAADQVSAVGELVPTASEAAAAAAAAPEQDQAGGNGEDPADGVGAAALDRSGPAQLVLFTALGLALLGAAGYLVHRRLPLHAAAAPRRSGRRRRNRPRAGMRPLPPTPERPRRRAPRD